MLSPKEEGKKRLRMILVADRWAEVVAAGGRGCAGGWKEGKKRLRMVLVAGRWVEVAAACKNSSECMVSSVGRQPHQQRRACLSALAADAA